MSGEEQSNGVKPGAGKHEVPEELRRLPKPSQLFMLLSLFVRPSLALLIVQLHRMWVVPALLILALVTGVAMCSTLSLFRGYYPVVNEIVRTVGDDVAPITMANGRMGWRGDDKPYSKEVRGWRMDFGDACDESALRASEEQHGVCVTPKCIYIWFKDFPEHGKFRIEQAWKERQIKSFGEALAKKGEDSLDREALVGLGKMCCVFAVPLIFAAMFLKYFWVILLCQIIFCVTTSFLRRDSAYSFADLVVLGISLSLIPTLVSIVWSIAAPLSWGFDNIYFVAFVMYLMYAFHDAKKGFEKKQDDDAMM